MPINAKKLGVLHVDESCVRWTGGGVSPGRSPDTLGRRRTLPANVSHRTIATILRHDSKQTSYEIALLRSLNDVVLAYPDVGRDGRDVAVPLRALAEAWVASYWPFVAPGAPVAQGVRSLLAGELRQDVGGSRGGGSCVGRRGERRRAGDHSETRRRSPSARITF